MHKKIMEQKIHGAKIAFFYLLSLVALCFLAIGTGTVFFQVINSKITDIIKQYEGMFAPDAIRFGLSCIIISAPIFFITSRKIYQYLYKGELSKDSGIRKWLTYFILLVTSIVMIGWLIGTLNVYLNGEMTLKFILKSLTAISISAIIFSFYLYDIKRPEVLGKKDQVIKIYCLCSIIFVTTAVVIGFFLSESPQRARLARIDVTIVERMMRISENIEAFYNSENTLPKDIKKLSEPPYYLEDEVFTDPETKENFEYTVISDLEYDLCANFRTDSKDESIHEERMMFGDEYSKRFEHNAGRYCIRQMVQDSKQLPESKE